ncbi:MAG: HAD-IIIA family hydrolase [Thermoguttaceae bacterium]
MGADPAPQGPRRGDAETRRRGEGTLRNAVPASPPPRVPASPRPLQRPAAFLDRDGVIIENRPDYVKCWEEVRFLPGALAALRRLAASHLAVVIVSNQASIGRGLLAAAAAWEIHRRLVAEIERHGGRIDASYFCPHRPESGCDCRKPAAGMLHQAAAELDLDVRHSWMVGDALSDLQAARAAGARAVLVRTGRGAQQEALLSTPGAADWSVVPDLPAAVDHILRALDPRI